MIRSRSELAYLSPALQCSDCSRDCDFVVQVHILDGV